MTVARLLSLMSMTVFFASGCTLFSTVKQSPTAQRFSQGQNYNEPSGKIQFSQEKLPEPPKIPPSDPMSLSEYRIGKDDELNISVYGDDDLAKIQTVRPDGKIAFPLLGDIQASGATPDELRELVTQIGRAHV